MSRPFHRFVCAFAAAALLLAPGAAVFGQAAQAKEAKPAAFDAATVINQLKARNIGPANMGGRVVDLAVPDSDTTVIYAAVGPSGLWKSVDSGITWIPSFHEEATVAVGAVAVSPSHPDIVWAGTGEATARNSVAPGDGVYKSEDGGRTWKNMGLARTLFISRIAIDPVNPDIVYVAAQGHLWGSNEDRGVYRTQDGGKTWKKVLYLDSGTGASDLVMDPSNSKILYAGMWDHLRKPYHFRSGGPGSGLYKTTDGGDTWTPLTQGLPKKPWGRIGLGVARSNPNVVYVLIEAEGEERGLFRSEDKGFTWRRMSDARTYDRVNFRPFYYSRLTVDPSNELVVYVYSGSCFVSRDAGRTFEQIFRGAHPDHHAVWVNPDNPRHVISGNDGGIDISWDGGVNAYGVASQAWAEVYNVGFDMRDPYYVNVGLQDNGNWLGPSNTRERAGILNHYWIPTGGGDGYYAQFDPIDWWVMFRNLQMGGIERHNLKTGESQRVRPEAPLSEPPYRFNWNSPILLSRHNRFVLYFGGNYLFKSTDRGMSWTKASPDLTTNDPAKIIDSGGLTMDNTGAENHCTILTISESPLKEGLIWVGTDDGQVQVTRDGGATWENVTKNIRGFAAHDNWVTRIEASHHVEGGVYLTVSRHQVADYKPYVFKSTDFGKTWTSIRGNLPEYGYLHTVREDIDNPNLLFVGSEFGLFITLDGGANWISYRNGFPTIAVRDIKIHPRDRDLIIGTHGRGVWIIDDIRALSGLTAEGMKAEALLFDVKPATLFATRTTVDMYSDPGYAGENSPYGAALTYYLNPAAAKTAKIKLAVVDKDGREIAWPGLTNNPGLNRMYWNLREGAAPSAAAMASAGGWGGRGAAMGLFGPWALPGEYKVVLEVNGRVQEKPLIVREDELQDHTMEEREMGRTYFLEARELSRKGRELIQALDGLTKQFEELAPRISAIKPADVALTVAFMAVRDKIDEIKAVYFLSPPDQGFFRKPILVAFRGGTAAELVIGVVGAFGGMGRPTQTAIDQMNDFKNFIAPLLAALDDIRNKDIPALNKLLAEKGVPYLK
ncbi:MAG: hypothetical protein SCM96_00965 [Acidobacteriota bacterium]|nr:hypothetical protein [Acidobacteriota bacterium]